MDWRVLAYYPLGLLPSIFFSLRFLIQWLQSEKKGESYVTPLFWKLSISGNLLLLMHYLVQLQFPFALIQAGNAVISWRNINLLGPREKRISFQSVIFLFGFAFTAISLFFVTQGELFRIPVKLGQVTPVIEQSLGWHLLGIFGGLLFASRFFVQWWQSEHQRRSHMGRSFWVLSIVGSFSMLLYFIRIEDTVSILNCSFGLVPYLRNLMLLNKKAT